jgi:Uma2 family endonuclease
VAVYAHLDPDELYRYSLADYHRLIDAGVFGEDERVELLEGFLVRMSPKTPRHERAVRWLARWLIQALDERYEVGVGNPLTIGDSEPEPDLVVFERGTPEPYHPSSAVLVIEVAVSSRQRDLLAKPAVYAAAGVTEYWVFDVDAQRLVVHRDPGPNGYATTFDAARDQELKALAGPIPALAVGDLLAATQDRHRR